MGSIKAPATIYEIMSSSPQYCLSSSSQYHMRRRRYAAEVSEPRPGGWMGNDTRAEGDQSPPRRDHSRLKTLRSSASTRLA